MTLNLRTHSYVAPAQAGAYLVLRFRRIDVMDSSLRWGDGGVAS
jgi:hypothetical protein